MNDRRKVELAIYCLNTARELLDSMDKGDDTFYAGTCVFQPINVPYRTALVSIRENLEAIQ